MPAELPSLADADAGRRASGGAPVGLRAGAALLALMLVPAPLAGAPLVATALAFAFWVAWVLLPGLALLARLGRERDELRAAGLALLLGAVALGLAMLACRAAGAPGAVRAWPVAALGLAWLARLRSGSDAGGRSALPRGEAPRGSAAPLVAVLALALVRVPFGFDGAVDGWYLTSRDLVFHGGNAAELLREGPLLDPRVAGRPLNYHLLSHALAASASAVTGASIADVFRWWFLGFAPLVLLTLVFALARDLGGSARAGLLATLALALHGDLGVGLLGEAPRSPLELASHLDRGLFVSPPTALGLALLVGIAATLARVLAAPSKPAWARLALLAAGASLAKGSVMPAAIAGAGLAALLALARRRAQARTWVAAALVLALAAAPATLYLSLAPGSYAGAMFRFSPWASAVTSKMGAWLVQHAEPLQRASVWGGGALVFVPWIAGFLGLGGVGTLAWLAARRPALGGIGPWIAGAALAGLALGTFLLAPGSSQLFFAYDAQVLLAIPAGVGAAALLTRSRALAAVLALLALPFVAAGIGCIVRDLGDRRDVAASGPELWPRWREGAAWIRANAPDDALLVTRDNGVLLSLFAERRVALADAMFTPEVHATRWVRAGGQWRLGPPSEAPFAAREQAIARAFTDADAPSLARLREETAHAGELWLVLDLARFRLAIRDLVVPPLGDAGRLEASPELERVFRNEVMAVYRVR